MPCLIGRGKEADLILDDQTISHRHALIDITSDQLWIKDLSSANGVWVNGARIIEKTFLHPGDFIQLGKIRLLLPFAEDHAAEHTIVLQALGSSAVSRELDHRRLELIYDITTEFPVSQDVMCLGDKIFARFKEYFQQDHGSIALFDKDGEIQPLCSDSGENTPLPLSRSIVNRVFQNGESLLLEDALSSDSFKQEESIIALRIRSAMCAPLIFHNQINGLIYLDRNIPGAYSQSDLELFQSIAAIIAPLIENARLWSELREKYSTTVDRLKNTEARLIDTERVAAYVRLAQAMAHEVRNPLTALGGLIKRLARADSGDMDEKKFSVLLELIDRIEMVLQEMDTFSKLVRPRKELVKIDTFIREMLAGYQEEWNRKQIFPEFHVETSQLMVPLDPSLLLKALAMVIKEILFRITPGSQLPVSVHDADGYLELRIGKVEADHSFSDPFDPVFAGKPWCNSLFLNIAHKILLDHGGKLLLNTEGASILPLVLLIPRSIGVEDSV